MPGCQVRPRACWPRRPPPAGPGPSGIPGGRPPGIARWRHEHGAAADAPRRPRRGGRHGRDPVRGGGVVAGTARHRAGRGPGEPVLHRGRGRGRDRRVRRAAGPARRPGRRAHAGGGGRPLGRGHRWRAARRAARRGGPARLHRGLPGGAGRQRPRPAPVPPARVHRHRHQARVLPALGHRRPGDAPDLRTAAGRQEEAPGRPPPGQAGEMTLPLVLGIETSCDETGAGLVRGHELLADSVASSVAEHARFGGVVPEVASRAHLEAMVATVDRALATAGVKLAEVDGVAVTAGPGLAGALLVGVSAAKAYALALGKPLYAVNHLAAHIAVDQLEHGPLPVPAIALLVSGGHSSLLLTKDVAGDVQPLGATIDDAAGEAYDKVARVLGLPFPGGPPIDIQARSGDPAAIAFPRAKYRDQTYDFSFSGLKTAVARWVEERRSAGLSVPVADVAASFQEAVADVLTRKAVRACQEHGVEHLIIGGGVAANSRLRALAAERCAAAGLRLRVPRPGLCTDNGAMVAALGAELLARDAPPSALGFAADSALPVTSITVP